ncbi:deoxyribodipyrimidine photo-lyase [Mariniphaga anaerophila]|uniref:Deoxyribodipyrimidine photo-lyase n=1 Tax=Mariniphaga anaerophila TaxID=1484053 RepID=A0A1M4SH27_9BACT|nr:deoxyribodipyrimidine photo-lyase [Mariniphaga anaerophila]SHE31496.1 deoxyribodipyrimidine photo-lyase [Mariniphaga anaerophila]
MKQKISVFWFRRDLRLHDNHALFEALKSPFPVLSVFIFDTKILEKLNSRNDARVSFVHSQVWKIKTELEKLGSSLKVFHATPDEAFRELVDNYDIQLVFANKDYEPYAQERDKKIETLLSTSGVVFKRFKDQVIFEENEVLKDDGNPYTVFTPYSKKWKQVLGKEEIPVFPSENLTRNYLKIESFFFPQLNDLGFEKSLISIPPPDISEEIIRNYEKTRDFPALTGTSKLGVHLRFGTVSIREVTRKALLWSDTFCGELIWRNFFSTILWHFPHAANEVFNPKYKFVRWRNNEEEFEKWSRGETGYPFVDAGMRELNTTGFMHNRARMITAGFLTKHLLVDWRWGEAYFAEKLLDYDLASNNGNWQWAAGTGCDAAPYFRIFNPESQQKKFDSKGEYVQKWIPEIGTVNYPAPIVEHQFARERALKVFRDALK